MIRAATTIAAMIASVAVSALAQTPPAPATVPTAAPSPAPTAASSPASSPAPAKDSLSVYFDNGSSSLRADALPVLDQAARLYRAGQPIVMILTATTDPTGSPIGNLGLSQLRADAVLRGLVARGIPAERFQLLAKGQTELPVAAKQGMAEPRDRQVEIAWR